jgi:uncharacterized OB-fold protein
MSDHADEGFDEFLGAIEAGEGYYLECANGHGHLPPRRVCPDCGSTEFERAPLPAAGEVATQTTTHVATPNFEADAPYVVAVVDFGPVRLTGQVRDADPEAVSVGTVVEVDLEETATTGEDVLVFRPR